MAGRIPQHFIDELIARTDIIEVIGSRVQLKRAGREYKACCPFHDEKTPSFTVSPDKQFYHCFGCGAHGTALGFVMEYDHTSFVEAVEDLAARAGLDVPREGGAAAPAQPHDELYVALERAGLFYRQSLSGEARAREYLDRPRPRPPTSSSASGSATPPPAGTRCSTATAPPRTSARCCCAPDSSSSASRTPSAARRRVSTTASATA